MTVSVVMPFHNAAATIERALSCLCRQTLAELEIVVIDDGSSDGGHAIAADFARRDARVRLERIPHGGIVRALTAGLDLATGDYIARMDADDTCPPERIERQLAALLQDHGLGVVSGKVDFGGDPQTSRGFALYVDWLNELTRPQTIALNRFVESPLAHPSVLFRRHLLDRFGGYREGDFPEDYELWLRWLDAGVAMAKVDDVVLTWHDLPGRLTRTDARYAQPAIYALKADYLARWLARCNPRHPGVCVWGAGRLTRKRAERLVEHGIRIDAYIDIDPRKIGQTIQGRPVLGPDAIPAAEEAFIVAYVGSRGARQDIRQRLTRRGRREGVDFICAA